jgi:hypothetical protein
LSVKEREEGRSRRMTIKWTNKEDGKGAGEMRGKKMNKREWKFMAFHSVF